VRSEKVGSRNYDIRSIEKSFCINKNRIIEDEYMPPLLPATCYLLFIEQKETFCSI